MKGSNEMLYYSNCCVILPYNCKTTRSSVLHFTHTEKVANASAEEIDMIQQYKCGAIINSLFSVLADNTS